MEISSVEVFDLEVDLTSEEWSKYHPVIVRVNTDEGISGIGEVAMASGMGHSAAASMVEEFAGECLLGSDPLEPEKLWKKITEGSYWGLGGGAVIHGAVGGIDIALWDIKGKESNKPIHELLGGKANDKLRCYASQTQFGWDDQLKCLSGPDEYATEAKKAVDQGYDCIKIDPLWYDPEGNPGWDASKKLTPEKERIIYERVEAVRDKIGTETDIILELHSSPTVPTAIKLCKRLEEFDILLCEEPVHSLNPALLRKIVSEVEIPIAAGEKIYSTWGFREYFEDQTLTVAQPDLGLAGGMTEGKKICDYANVYDVGVQPHVYSTPISNAAALQLEAVIPNFFIHEFHTFLLKENLYEICDQTYEPKKGRIEIPDKPGLGISIDDDAVESKAISKASVE